MNANHLINFQPVTGTNKSEAIRLQIEAAILDNVFLPETGSPVSGNCRMFLKPAGDRYGKHWGH